jgi:hypothetical protein
MDKASWFKLSLAVVLLAAAGALLWRFSLRTASGTGRAFFYDLSLKKLFAAPRTAIPPIQGLDDPEPDAVRAVVVSTTGHPENKSSWKIAYLEVYSPVLKRQMEAAQAAGTSPAMGRAEAQHHRFVRRLADTAWSPISSPEAERILTEWTVPGTNGITPVVCTP